MAQTAQKIGTLPSECKRNWESREWAVLVKLPIVQFWWAHVNCCLLFLADRRNTWCGLLLLWPICFSVLCVQRHPSAYLGWYKVLFEVLLSSCYLVWPFFSDLWYQKDFFSWRTFPHPWLCGAMENYTTEKTPPERQHLVCVDRLNETSPDVPNAYVKRMEENH